MNGAPEDSILLELARAGDVSALGHLYDRYGTTLYRLAHALTRNADQAESVVLQVFTDACAAGSLPTPRPVRAELTHLVLVAYLGFVTSHDLAAEVPGSRLSRREWALVGLTLHGDHTYRDAAAVLELDPAVAAETLSSALRAWAAPARPLTEREEA